MNWAEIQKLYVGAVGSSPASVSESLVHLNQGNRDVCSRLDVQELEAEFPAVTTTSQDFTELPSGIYHIRHVDNVTTGRRVDPEPGGMRGRSQYLASESGMPEEGEPVFYVPSQGRLFLRPTPDDVYDLRIRAKKVPEEVTAASMGFEPEIPLQYHMAIAQAAAKSYFMMHPDQAAVQASMSGTDPVDMVQRFDAALNQSLVEPMLPKDQERFDQSRGIRIRGYNMRFRVIR